MTTAIAAPTRWQIDPTHTDVEFSVRHLMISNVKGRFAAVTGSVALDDTSPATPAVDVSIDAASIDTRNDQRDTHLRSADFFNTAEFPTLTFRSRSFSGDPAGRFTLVGDLTIRGITREVVLAGEFEGRGGDPWGNERLGFSASGTIDRRAFGLTWNQALEAGGVAVGHEVKISINTELSRPKG